MKKIFLLFSIIISLFLVSCAKNSDNTNTVSSTEPEANSTSEYIDVLNEPDKSNTNLIPAYVKLLDGES